MKQIFKKPLLLIVSCLFIFGAVSALLFRNSGSIVEYEKLSFAYGQLPTITVNAKGISPDDIIVRDSKNILVEGIDTQVEETEYGSEIKLSPKGTYKPGVYTLQIKGTDIKQDFTWGVLAINTNKDTYMSNEDAKVAIAVLDQEGGMVCKAEVRLDIKFPDGRVITLSTENGQITANSECKKKELVEKDDFEASFQTGNEGVYEMYLTAYTPHQGEYTIKDSFTVDNSSPFYIQRDTRTRIYPPLDYPVNINIEAKQDFKGQIIETVPASFGISNINDDIPHQVRDDSQTNITPVIPDEQGDDPGSSEEDKQIVWNVEIKKGQTTSLTYTYDAPDISPYFHTLGELKFIDEGGNEIHSEHRKFHIASDALDSMRPTADHTTTGWTAATGSNLYEMINDDPDSSTDTTDYIDGPNSVDGSAFFEIGPLPAGFLQATDVKINAKHQDFSAGVSGGNDTIEVFYQVFESNGTTALTAESSGNTLTQNTYTIDETTSLSITGTNDADTWDGALLRVRQVDAQVNGPDDNNQIRLSAAEVNLTYDALEVVQDAFIFENDDGANVNSNTDMASANKEVTKIEKGQRFVARIQLANEGTSSSDYDYKLQYDRGDANWSDVDYGGAPSGNNGTDPSYKLSTINTTNQVGVDISIAIGTDGYPVISHYDSTDNALVVTKCNDAACSGGDETTSTVDDPANDVGYDTSIAIGTDGYPVISYQDFDAKSLKVAKCNDTACSGTPTITPVDDPANDVGYYSSIAIGTDGYPVISYWDFTANSLKVAKCNTADCSGTPTITTVDDPANNVGSFTSIAIGTDGLPVISYRDSTARSLKVAKCNTADCSGTPTITTVDDPANNVGYYSSIAIGVDGLPVISYQDSTATSLKVAKCNTTACSGTPTITTVDDPANNVGSFTSIAIGIDGLPVISYYDGNATALSLKVAKCNDTACSGGDEDITTVDDPANNVGSSSSIAIGTDGYPVISYRDTTANSLKVAKYLPNSGVSVSPALSGSTGDSLTSQVAGTCQTTSSANGEFREATPSAYLSLANDTCTELAFAIDTENAIPGETYRLRMVLTSGIELIRYDEYPTFTVVDNASSPSLVSSTYFPPNVLNNFTKKYSKDNVLTTGDCTDTDYECSTVDDPTNTVGYYASIAIGADGLPVISYYDSTANSLKVAKCNDTACSSSPTITTVDDPANGYTSIAIGTDGYPVISYYDATALSLKVAKCNDTACSGTPTITTVDDPANDVGAYSSIAIGTDGSPVISYRDSTANSLKVAKCTTTDCSGTPTITTVDDPANSVGTNSSIAIGADGLPVIGYYDSTAFSLKVAKCNDTACSSSPTITTVDDPANGYTSIAIGTDGYPVISYYDATALSLKVAKCNDTACSGGDEDITTVDDPTNEVGTSTSIAIGTDGLPVIGYYDATADSLKVAKCNDTACSGQDEDITTVDDPANNVGLYTTIAIGTDGLPVIGYYDATADSLKVSKLVNNPTIATGYFDNNQNILRYDQFDQTTATSSAQFAANSPLLRDGMQYWLDKPEYDALLKDDTTYDAVTSGSTETPMFKYADKFDGNSNHPSVVWIGQSTVAPSTNNLYLQVYRFGSTNAWETVATNSSCSANTDCVLEADAGDFAGSSASDYYFFRPAFDHSQAIYQDAYWTYWRVYQAEGSQTLKADMWNPRNEVVGFEGINFEGINIY